MQKLQNFDVLNNSRRMKQLFSHFESSIVEPNLQNIEYLKGKNAQRKRLIEDLMHDDETSEARAGRSGSVQHEQSESRVARFADEECAESSIIAPNKSVLGLGPSGDEEKEHKEGFLRYLKRKINYVEPKYTKIEETLVDKKRHESQRRKELLHLNELYGHESVPAHLRPLLPHLFETKRSEKPQFSRKSSLQLDEVRRRKWAQGQYNGVHKIIYHSELLSEIRNVFEKLDDHKTLVVSAKKLLGEIRRNDYLKQFMSRTVLGFVNLGSFGELSTESRRRR